MGTTRAHITLPPDVLADLDRFVEKRQRSRFITEAVRKELLIARQRAALRSAAGSWKAQDHPELKSGAAACGRNRRAGSASGQ
jgi:metal-responsive CopG/Arc/MetJ family transcriptional regulator